MERKPHIAVFLGTARTGRKTEQVATYITEVMGEDERVEVQLYDVRDYMTDRTIPNWQPEGEAEKTTLWRAVAAKADAFVMVCPEYNSGYPGEWKMVMDQDESNYLGKPAMIVGVSAGGFMGARMMEHMNSILNRLGFVYVHAPLYFGKVQSFIDSDASARAEQYKERIQKSLSKLLTYESRLHGINAELNQK